MGNVPSRLAKKLGSRKIRKSSLCKKGSQVINGLLTTASKNPSYEYNFIKGIVEGNQNSAQECMQHTHFVA